VAGAGDGQELGQALDDAHQGGLEQGKNIHGGGPRSFLVLS
jgi:hypothetical protein